MLTFMRGRGLWGDPSEGNDGELRQEVAILGIPTYRQALRGLHAELRRARRYQHPLTVVALSPAGLTLEPQDAERIRAPHLSFYLLGSLLRDVLRETDVPTYSAEHHLYAVFMLETREAEAVSAVDRLRELFHGRTGARVRAGTAEFPRDGLTVDDLLSGARLAWEERPHLEARESDTEREVKNA